MVYEFFTPDDEPDVIFYQWLNRDELSCQEVVSLTNNNIDIISPTIDTTPQNPQVLDTVEPTGAAIVCKGLKLKLQ